MKYGETENICWSGLNIGDNEKVNIKLKRNNKLKTIASALPYSINIFKWPVTQPHDLEATISIELASNSNINVEKQVYISTATANKIPDNDQSDSDDSSSQCFITSVADIAFLQFYNIVFFLTNILFCIILKKQFVKKE